MGRTNSKIYGQNELKDLADEGIIDHLAGYVRPFAEPHIYIDYGYVGISEQPALSGENYNNQVFIEVSPVYLENALRLVAHNPIRYLAAVQDSYLRFSAPSSLYPHLTANAASMGVHESFVSQILLGNILFAQTEEEPKGSFLLFLMPLSLVFYVGQTWLWFHQRLFNIPWERLRRQLLEDIPLHFMFFLFLYTLLVGVLFEHGENERFKFMIEPIWCVFFAVLVYRLFDRKFAKTGNLDKK